MRILDRRHETMSRPELEQFQLERLQALVARLRRNVRRYREKLGDLRLESLAGINQLPFTTPEDIAAGFPYGMFAFPLREIIRVHSAVGPEGKPLVIGHTRNDLAQWGRLVARQLTAAGVTPNDVIQISLGNSAYAAGSGFTLGAELIEASVIAEDPKHMDYQLAILRNYRPTILVTTPGNAVELMRTMELMRIDPQSLHLRTVILSRPVPAEIRAELASGLFAAVQCAFGLAEVVDPGLCVECEEGHFHIHEDHFLPEICEGELVLTTLNREALPLLRYRTRIAASLGTGKCTCGRTGAILLPGGRLDRQLRVGEVVFYEPQIAAVLAQTRAAGHRFSLQVAEGRLTINVGISEALFAKTIASAENPRRQIELELLARLGLEAEVRFVEPQSVPNAAEGQVAKSRAEGNIPA